MFVRTFLIGALMVLVSLSTSAAPSTEARDIPAVSSDGTVTVRSAYPMAQTIERLKQDIVSKGITFFIAIEQSKLAGDAGVELRPSTLLIFGNPALGAHFITANPLAGLDWPVRLLVFQDESGAVRHRLYRLPVDRTATRSGTVIQRSEGVGSDCINHLRVCPGRQDASRRQR